MSKKGRNRLGFVDSVVSLADWAWRNASSILAAIFGGGWMTNLARATDWSQGFGPLGWGLIGLATFATIMLVLGFWTTLVSKSRLRASQAKIADRLASSTTFNPLDERFERQVVRLSDFVKPDGSPITNRRFENCDIVGPLTVVLTGNISYSGNKHSFVEFARVGNVVGQMPNKLILADVEIRDCRIYNVLFLVPSDHQKVFEAGFNGGIPWIN